MTVLTFPTTGSKSDKEPLVDHEAATAAAIDRLPASGEKQPPFDPKRLESGDLQPLRRPTLRETRKRLRFIRAMLVLILVLATGMCIASLSLIHTTCFEAAVNHKKQHHDVVAMPQNAQTDDAAAASVPCRSFTSYDAAEKDLAQLQQMRASATEQPQDDYDTAALQFNTVQVSSAGGGGGEENPPVGGGSGGFKRLEEYAIRKAIVYSKKILDGIAVANANNANGGVVVESTAADPAVVAGVASPPPVTVTKSARFIHDFSINITGIVDPEGQRCFVMSLVRNDITAPSSLDDLLDKMATGYYSSDLSKLLNEMRIVKPALDLTQADYGLYISRDCADYPTYKLEKKVISTTTAATTTAATTSTTTTTTTTAAAQPADATTVVTLV